METDSALRIDLELATGLDRTAAAADVCRARRILEQGSGPGAGMTGWLELPARMAADLDRLEEVAADLRRREAVVVVGIGGSYLGARAVIEALGPPFDPAPKVLFAGHNLDARYHGALLERLAGADFAVNVISKSGTTTEPGCAFRFLWEELGRRFGGELSRRVVATTDRSRGALRELANAHDLPSFEVPDDVGGRFSVLTAVGLLPVAIAGIDARALLAGARGMMERLRAPAADGVDTNPALAYAAFRLAAFRAGKRVEVLSTTAPHLFCLAEWWKQLFGESEGKGGHGLFPAALSLTTDLHSLGQWMQDGPRIVAETALDIVEERALTIPAMAGDRDGLGHLAGRAVHEVNRIALAATLEAHRDGGVPCCRIEIDRLDAARLGALLYFFEYACGVSAYALGVNPFDQPGVEAYKKNMHRLLG
jgi:glucose-6-phosphate isomerase